MVKNRIWILFFLLSIIAISGCDLLRKDSKDQSAEFKRGPEGLVMGFVQNYPGDKYLVSENEDISIIIDVRNKGTHPEGDHFAAGVIYLSGFDDEIIKMNTKSKSLSDSDMFLRGVSPVNPLGSFATAEFDGEIIADKITVDRYTPTILATACYPYVTKASPTVCIDPFPFDDRQEKVCNIGSQTLSSQGAPVAVTRIDQEASTNKIQFKIHIKNVGDGDVLKSGVSAVKDKDDGNEIAVNVLDRCSPLSGGRLNRKDFDRVQVTKIEVGSVDLWSSDPSKNKCSPFADGTNDIIRLFDGEGFVICTLTVSELGGIESAYTTPLNVELSYSYRSTISKQVKISKLTPVSSPSAISPLPTVSPTPNTCTAPNIRDDTNARCIVSQNSIAFRWDPVDGATRYIVSWCPGVEGKNFNSNCLGYGEGDSDIPVKHVTGLEPDTNYKFKVFVTESDDTCIDPSPESEIGNCKTEGGTTPAACDKLNEDCSTGSCCNGLFCDSDGACSEIDLRCAAPTIPDDINFRCSIGLGDTIKFNWDVVVGASEYNVSWCPGVKGVNFEVGDQNCDSERVKFPNKVISGIGPNINYNYKVFVTESRDNVCIPSRIVSNIGSCATCGGLNQECCGGEAGSGTSGTCRSGFVCDEEDNFCNPV